MTTFRTNKTGLYSLEKTKQDYSEMCEDSESEAWLHAERWGKLFKDMFMRIN